MLLRFLRLSPEERGLLVRAALLLWIVRLGLWTLPFRTLQRLLFNRAQAPAYPTPLSKIVWAVEVTSSYVPSATCLTRALAARTLLARYGHPSDLRIGVAKSAKGTLEAHAWLEHRGRIVLGGLRDLSRYQPLPPLGGDTPNVETFIDPLPKS